MTIKILAAVLALGISGAAAARDITGIELQTVALEVTSGDTDIEAEPAIAQANIASPQELDSLLAPIALYPDQLLSQILMAATYPLDIIEAARWAQRPEAHNLKGQALADAIDDKPWNPSVKALVGFPEILKMLDADLDWMAKLGDSFVAQETAVMDSVQRLRQEARDAGGLNTDGRQRITMDDEQIIIELATPELVYVPIYDPRVAYGAWPYPDYPPYYLPPPYGYAYSPGIYYSFVSISPFWGWSRWDWRDRRITIIDLPRYNHHNRWRGRMDRTVWHHDPRHGGGVRRDRDRDGVPDRWENRRRDNTVNNQNNWRPDNAANRDFRRPRPDGAQPGTNSAQRRWDNSRGDDQRRRRNPTTPGTQLPDVSPPLPATAQLPQIPPPVASAPEPTQPRFGNRVQGRDQANGMRGMRRDGREPGDAPRQERQEQRRRQFQDRSIGAPPLTNIPPQQQAQPSVTDRFSGQRGGRRDSANAFQAPAIAPEAAPAQQQPVNTDNFRQRRQESGGQNFGGGGNGGGDGGRGRGRRGAPAEAEN